MARRICANCGSLCVIYDDMLYIVFFERWFCKELCFYEYSVNHDLVQVLKDGTRIPFRFTDKYGNVHIAEDMFSGQKL